MSVFHQPKPVRVRIEGEGVTVDVIVPAFLLMFPDVETNGAKMAIHGQAATSAQSAELIATAIRYGVAAGVMQSVMTSLCSTPLDITVEHKAPPRSGQIPPDDLPAHLRTPPPKKPGT